MKFSMSTESAIACDSADRLLLHFLDSVHDFHSIIPTGASSPVCSAWDDAYIRYPPCDDPSGRTPHAASLNTPKFNWSMGIACIWMGSASSFCACLTILFAFCKLLMVGLAVSLADNDTFAERSVRGFVDSHCSDPLMPRRVVSPVASNLFSHLACEGSLGCGTQRWVAWL